MSGYLIFGGIDSRDYDVFVSFSDIDTVPRRVYTKVDIVGKNGAVLIDEGKYEDVPHSYDCIVLDNEKRVAFVNAIMSKKGYQRLTDSYGTDEYYTAVLEENIEQKTTRIRDKYKFKLVFTRKPQRFLTSGEEPVDYIPGQAPADEQTKTGPIVTFDAEEDTIISDLVADIEPVQDLHGYDKPWTGGNGKNILPFDLEKMKIRNTSGSWSDNKYTVNGITFTVNSDGSVTASGTASSQAQLVYYGYTRTSDTDITYENVTISSGVVGSSSTYRVVVWGAERNCFIDNAEVVVRGSFTMYGYGIRIMSGQTVNNLLWKPMIRLSAETDDTFEPYTNICPISGWEEVKVSRTGKNILPFDLEKMKIRNTSGSWSDNKYTVNGITFTVNSDGSVTASGTASSQAQLVYYGYTRTSDTDITYENVTISSGVVGSSSTYRVVVWGAERNCFIDNAEVVVRGSFTMYGYGIRIMSGQTVNNLLWKPMIRLASETDASYKPYNGNTYTIDLDGTRYGGTLDVTSGVLTADRAIVDLGTLTWSKNTGVNPYFGATVSGARTDLSSLFTDFLCDSYAYAVITSSTTADGICFVSNANLRIRDSQYISGTATQFKQAISGTMLVYPLATPITVQLTPTEVKTLLGTNNVWADSGNVTAKYGTNPYAIVNPTPFDAQPLLKVTGKGVLGIGDYIITITGTTGQVIYIDCETMEIYKDTGGIITPASSLISFATNEFPKLPSGVSGVSLGDGITEVEITPRWWII